MSAKEAAALPGSAVHADDAEMSHELMCRVYAMADGRALLVFENGRGLLYESHQEMVSRYRASVEEAKRGPVNPFGDLLPQGEGFAKEVPNLIASLEARLRLDRATLDAVDGALRKMSMKRILTADVFAPLVAVAGEAIREAIGGRWEMRLDSDGRTWIPWVVDNSGWSCAPVRIYKELLEHGRSGLMRVFVDGTLGGSRLSNRRPP